MIIVPTKIYAAASAYFCERYSLVRGVGVACALAVTGMAAAHAGPDKEPQRDPREARPAQQAQPAPQRLQAPAAAPPAQREPVRNDVRQFDQRAIDEQRRALQLQQDQSAHSAESARRSGRLTPDERRDLRRQINEAGIDLYPNTPRR